jgi:serine/threonine protein kinase
MDFDTILLEILDRFIDGKSVDINEYCLKYPDHKDAILTKFRAAEFIKKSFKDEDFSGKKLGDYLILQELGRGGMGIVLLGIQPALSRLTAIKVLPPNFSADKDTLKNFQEEAKTIAKFSHPNIVPIYSISTDAGIYYIAMAYISGMSFKDILDKLRPHKDIARLIAASVKEILQASSIKRHDITQKSITLKRNIKFWDKTYFQFIATIGAEIANALNYAHQNDIIHGDLKPSNILLTDQGIPMLVDFGLSKNIKNLAASKSKEFVGTLSYAAPEQIKENTINEKTDIWSLGVTLYELLTFKNPFIENTVKKIVDKILRGYPVSLRSHNRKIPIELDAIVLKCLENKPKDRYQSIAEVVQELNNFLESRPIKAKSIGIIGRTKKAIKRKPITASLLVVAACLFITSFIFGLKPLTDKYIDLIAYGIERGNITASANLFKKLEPIAQFYPYIRRPLPYIAELIGDAYAVKNDSLNMKEWYYKAIGLYIQMIDRDPKNIHTYRGAQLLDRLGHIDEAKQFYVVLLARSPRALIEQEYVSFLEKREKWDDELKFLADKSLSFNGDTNTMLTYNTLNCLQYMIKKSRYTLNPINTIEKAKNLLLSSGFNKEFVTTLFLNYSESIKNMITVATSDTSKLTDDQYKKVITVEIEGAQLKNQLRQQYRKYRQEIGS